MGVNFGKTAGDYGRYRAGFPDEFFDRISRFGVGRQGQRVLDLGTGAGTLARGFALRGCEVVGLDPSTQLLAEAERLDREAGVSVEYTVAHAEETGLPGGSFDVVTAGECWHWFDGPKAAAEARRVLKPGGQLVIAHFGMLPLPGNVVEATVELIELYNPGNMADGTSMTGVYPRRLRDVSVAGFEEIETFSFDVRAPYTHEAWRGRIRASAWIGASLPAEQVEHFDAELARLLRDRFPGEPLALPHRVFAVVGSSPPNG